MRWTWLLLLLLVVAGCQQKMARQPYLEPLEPSPFFGQAGSFRTPPAGTVARSDTIGAVAFTTGRNDAPLPGGGVDTSLVVRLPVPVTEALLRRGRERFEIYCSPCHGRDGLGDGMVVRRGYLPPPSYQIPRLRSAPLGHFFRVMTDGFGAMPPYGPVLSPADRWAVAAYIRALQFAYAVPVSELPAALRDSLPAAGSR